MEFKVGQRVKVSGNTLYPGNGEADFTGRFGTIDNVMEPDYTISNLFEYGVVLDGEPPYAVRAFVGKELEAA